MFLFDFILHWSRKRPFYKMVLFEKGLTLYLQKINIFHIILLDCFEISSLQAFFDIISSEQKFNRVLPKDASIMFYLLFKNLQHFQCCLVIECGIEIIKIFQGKCQNISKNGRIFCHLTDLFLKRRTFFVSAFFKNFSVSCFYSIILERYLFNQELHFILQYFKNYSI